MERVNQVLEDLLRACVLTYNTDWEKSLPYAEFSYNNSYQASFKMAPFEALYGRKCRTPLMWSEVGEQTFFGPAAIVEAEENVAKVRENLKIAQSKQKSYADQKRKDISFDVGEHVYLKVSPLLGTKRFHIKGKMSPRYVGPYPIVKRIGKVALQARAASRAHRSTPGLPRVSASEVCGRREESARAGSQCSGDPGVPISDPGLGREVNREHHHALLQGALE
jgi:hypothetical protein